MIPILTIMIMALIASIGSSMKSQYAPNLRAKIANSIAKGERRANERNSNPRPVCERCSRPPVLCVCHSLPPERITTDTKVLILQHPNEFRKKSFSTVPLIPLVLQNVSIVVGYSFNDVEGLAIVRDALEEGNTPLLLFPGPDAISLDGEGLSNLPKHASSDGTNHHSEPSSSSSTTSSSSSRLLILIDGTWAQARRMIRESPSLLNSCQQVQFASPGNSIYDAIRKEPEQHCLSTLECCAQSLLLLEEEEEPSSTSNNAREAATYLEDCLRVLVEQQLQMRQQPVPRHIGTATRVSGKHRRRVEIEKGLFDSDGRPL